MIRAAWDIWCDGGKDCVREGHSFQSNYENFDYTQSKKHIIQKAIRDGWKIGRTRHLCPSCYEIESRDPDQMAEREIALGDVPGQLKLGGIEITRQYIVNDELEGARIFRTAMATGDWTHWRGWADASIDAARKRVVERMY